MSDVGEGTLLQKAPLPHAPSSLPPKTFDFIESLLAVFPDMKRGERLGGMVAEPVAQRGNRLFFRTPLKLWCFLRLYGFSGRDFKHGRGWIFPSHAPE